MTRHAPSSLSERIREASRSLGFVATGITSADSLEADAEHLGAWLRQGYHGEMQYMARTANRANPRELLPEARSVVVVALPYAPALEQPAVDAATSLARSPPLAARIASFALGADYHVVVKDKLAKLARQCSSMVGRQVLARACVGSAPLLERALAQRSGLGFVGQNTLLYVPGVGSRVLLGVLLLDLDLRPDQPLRQSCNDCGSCRAACPTAALVAPYLLDARRCLAYLTIELGGPIPAPLRAKLGDRVFGCDACQDACPLNAAARATAGAAELKPRIASPPDLRWLLGLRSSGHKRLVRGTPLRRASRACLARNAAVALGNSGSELAVPSLIHALESDSNVMVRGHAAWALGRLGGPLATSALQAASGKEPDPWVIAEIREALASG